MNQRIAGRGIPSDRHTRAPFSSGANTKSTGFSNQKGAADRQKEPVLTHFLVFIVEKNNIFSMLFLFSIINVAHL